MCEVCGGVPRLHCSGCCDECVRRRRGEATSHVGVTSVDGKEVGRVCNECFMVKPCACQDGQL